MAIVYFDASALVKLVVDEAGSEHAATLWDRCDAAVASRLTHVEVVAALAASHRNHDLSDADVKAALVGFERFWSAVRSVELSEGVQAEAGRLARAHALRGADAVHLASALAIGDPGLIMAVWDRRLSDGARASGLSVSPSLDD